MTILAAIWRRAGLSALDPRLGRTEVAWTVAKIAGGAARGLRHRIWTGGGGYMLVGRRVTVRSPGRIDVTGFVFVEDDVEVQATSSNGVQLGRGVTIGRGTQIRPSGYYGRELGWGVSIGDGSNVGPMSYIGCAGPITIGKKVMMGPGVLMLAEQHGFADSDRPMKDQGVSRSGIVVEDDVWIGAGVRILDGVTIHRGAVVASGAVVNRDVEPYTIVGGIPARTLRARDGGGDDRH